MSPHTRCALFSDITVRHSHNNIRHMPDRDELHLRAHILCLFGCVNYMMYDFVYNICVACIRYDVQMHHAVAFNVISALIVQVVAQTVSLTCLYICNGEGERHPIYFHMLFTMVNATRSIYINFLA